MKATKAEKMRGEAPGPHAVNVFEGDCRKKKKTNALALSRRPKGADKEAHQTSHDVREVAEQRKTLGQRRAKDDEEPKGGEGRRGRQQEEKWAHGESHSGVACAHRDPILHIVHRGSDTWTHHTHTHTHPRQRAHPQN